MHEDIYDEFVEKATKLAANKKLGNPLQEGCEQGPQARRAAHRFARVTPVAPDRDLTLGTHGVYSFSNADLGRHGWPLLPNLYCGLPQQAIDVVEHR